MMIPLRNPENFPKLTEALTNRQKFAEVLFNVMFDEGLCGQDYDDQVKGAQAAGLIAGLALSVEDAVDGAQAFRDPTGERAAEALREVTRGSIQPDWIYDPKRDAFKEWLIKRGGQSTRPPWSWDSWAWTTVPSPLEGPDYAIYVGPSGTTYLRTTTHALCSVEAIPKGEDVAYTVRHGKAEVIFARGLKTEARKAIAEHEQRLSGATP